METTDYNKGVPLNELEIKDGKLEIEGLTKDNEYLLTFDNDYVFQKEENDETNYFLFGSFKGEKETYINSSDIKSVDELTFEQLEKVSGNKEIMGLGTGWIRFTSGCQGYSGSVTASAIDSGVTCSGNRCVTSSTAGQGSLRIELTCNEKPTTYSWNTSNSSYSLSCTECGLPEPECSSGETTTCYNGTTVTQTYRVNGGICDGHSSDFSVTRTRYNGSKSCSSSFPFKWGDCSYGSWTSSVSEPSCSKKNTTETKTVTYNGNKGNGSTPVILSKSQENISRTVYWNFTGWSGFDANFTYNNNATANYSISGYSNWNNINLPTAKREGYTFTGWSDGSNVYDAGSEINSGGPKTYTAIWSPNSYEYTIEFRSSTGKLLDTRKETHKFDETVTISHEPIPGYEVSDQQVKWDVPLNEHTPTHTITITYQIITYDIEYSLEVGNRYPSGNPTVNPNSSITTYNVESNTITFLNPTRTGYTFIGWFTEEGFINEKPSIPNGSVGNVKVYAKFEANSYPLTVTNTNDRVSVTGTINGEAYTLAPKQSITKQIVFDSDFTVTSDSTDPIYYTSDIRNHTTKDSYRSETISSKALATSMGGTESGNLSYFLEVGATRNTKTFTVELKNDNGEHDVENTVTVKIYDNLTGNLLSEISDETINMESGKQGNTVVKTDTVSPNSSKTINYVIPENMHLVVSTTNNSIQMLGYDNSSTGKTADYLTVVETPNMYSSEAKDIERKSYNQELGTSYVVFTTFDNAKDEYKGTTYPVMVVDNQYTKANYAFTSANTATFKLYECLTEDCTVKYNVQATEHDSNYNYYASIVSSEVEGESRELGSLSGTSGTFKYVDRYKIYKIVQESLVKDRYYS